MKRIAIALWIGLACTACQQPDASSTPSSANAPPSANVLSRETVPPGNCNRLVNIKAMPYRPGEMGGDRDYYALYNQGNAVVPCLIDALGDDTPIADPSEGPKVQDFRVGDLALMMLMHLEQFEYSQCAPPSVMRAIDSVGIQAFFDWVHDGNRKALQRCVAGIAHKRTQSP